MAVLGVSNSSYLRRLSVGDNHVFVDDDVAGSIQGNVRAAGAGLRRDHRSEESQLSVRPRIEQVAFVPRLNGRGGDQTLSKICQPGDMNMGKLLELTAGFSFANSAIDARLYGLLRELC